MILAYKGFKFKDEAGVEWTLVQDIISGTAPSAKSAEDSNGDNPKEGSVIPKELDDEIQRNLHG